METCARPAPESDVDSDGRATVIRLHTVSVTVDDTSADRDEMSQILHTRLASFDLRLSYDDDGRTVLTLTVEADDLWLAVLIVMHDIAATGYRPTALIAAPVTGPSPEITLEPPERPANTAGS